MEKFQKNVQKRNEMPNNEKWQIYIPNLVSTSHKVVFDIVFDA